MCSENRKEEVSTVNFNDFFSFREMVSMQIIKIVYILGMIFITIGGIIALFDNFLIGLVAIVLGNLIWRLVCESAILLFSIHDILGSIETNVKSSN